MHHNDLNCAETMLWAANEYYHLGMSKTALHAASAFGGGMGVEAACGALTGGLMALGVMFSTERSHRDQKLTDLRDRFVTRFRSHFGSTECHDVKIKHRSALRGCEPIVEETATLFEQIVAETRGTLE